MELVCESRGFPRPIAPQADVIVPAVKDMLAGTSAKMVAVGFHREDDPSPVVRWFFGCNTSNGGAVGE